MTFSFAAIRERSREQHGWFAHRRSDLVHVDIPLIYRLGLRRTTRGVLAELLGGPVTPAALLRDIERRRPRSP